MITILGWLFFPQNQSKTGINNDNDNNNNYYYMAKPVLGKSVRSDWFFLCPDLQYRPLPWKQSKPFIFVLEQSWQIQTLQPKQRKKNVNIVILHSKKDWNFTKISKMDEEDEHSPSEFYYPEDRETFDAETETGITKSRKP